VITRIVLIIGTIAVLAGCAAGGSSNGRKSVVAAFYPVAYAAERIGGSAYTVENLTPAGVEPHDLELSPRTIARIENADIVLYLGHGFQPAVSTAAEEGRGQRIDVLAGLPLNGSDPHVWLDPVLYARVVRKIAAALHRPAAGLLDDLSQLDRDYRNGLRHCQRREIVTSHEAFGYLARRYGLQQVAITGITPESEPSPQRLADVIKLVRKTHATTVFFETLVSPRLAKTVARDVGTRTAVLDPIEGAERGQTYFSLMRRNLAALRKALGCR
jgi:zinc transport system substrate-binding protein